MSDQNIKQVDLSVIVLNYRTPELVKHCLQSLAEERDSVSFEVLAVDNASQDGSVEALTQAIEQRGWGEWVRLLVSPVNGGFSAGNNLGLEAARGRYRLLLNSDTLVRRGALLELLDAAERHPRAGLVVPRLEDQNGKLQSSVFRWKTPLTELVRAANTGVVTKWFRRAQPEILNSGESLTVPWASFAAVLIKQELIEEIGMLDEGYFMYFEDMDYCRRAVAAGWDVLYWPRARVVHLRGGSSPVKALHAARERRPEYYYASRSRYYAKFYGRSGLWRANLYWSLGRTLSWCRERLGRRPVAACRAEWRDNWTNAWRPLVAHQCRDGES